MFQKEMYLYVKLLCLHAENYFSFFFSLLLFLLGVLLEVSMKKKETKHEGQNLLFLCGNAVTVGIKCFCLSKNIFNPFCSTV